MGSSILFGIIHCCKDCVPPKRHLGCHDHCEEYKKEKALNEERKENARKNQVVKISNYDFDRVMYEDRKRRKK